VPIRRHHTYACNTAQLFMAYKQIRHIFWGQPPSMPRICMLRNLSYCQQTYTLRVLNLACQVNPSLSSMVRTRFAIKTGQPLNTSTWHVTISVNPATWHVPMPANTRKGRQPGLVGNKNDATQKVFCVPPLRVELTNFRTLRVLEPTAHNKGCKKKTNRLAIRLTTFTASATD
jgi:hypothetical protein